MRVYELLRKCLTISGELHPYTDKLTLRQTIRDFFQMGVFSDTEFYIPNQYLRSQSTKKNTPEGYF